MRRLQVARLKLHKEMLGLVHPSIKLEKTCVKNSGFLLKEACDKDSKLLLKVPCNLHVIGMVGVQHFRM
jgi:hypothetical protein